VEKSSRVDELGFSIQINENPDPTSLKRTAIAFMQVTATQLQL
jgi:hypothetical protein